MKAQSTAQPGVIGHAVILAIFLAVAVPALM